MNNDGLKHDFAKKDSYLCFAITKAEREVELELAELHTDSKERPLEART